MYAYIDWNIYNKIEWKDKLTAKEYNLYNELENQILSNKIIVSYSNAHLNDIFRGYKKNPAYINNHLKNIKRLSNDLCICQYWNSEHANLHYRDVYDFFDEKKDERESEADSFSQLMSFDNPFLSKQSKQLFVILEQTPLPEKFDDCYKFEPLFEIMFPTAKIYKNMLSLCEDLYSFSIKIKFDYSLYRALKKYLNESIKALNDKKDILPALNLDEAPAHLNIFELSKNIKTEPGIIKNQKYSEIIDTFYKLDLQGYKTDKYFNNMFDDALHTFYGAHFEYFITIDDNCYYKAKETYKKLDISTVVLKPDEILSLI
jgi:hypothetical protein